MDNKKKSTITLNRRKVLKYTLLTGLSASLSPALWVAGCSRESKKKRPKIIFITVDTLRADHLGCYNYFRNTSPEIDSFASDSLVFENCLSHAPVTGSSFASIFSGFLPHETKVFANLPLPAEVRTFPEILRKHGYTTAAVVSNYALRRQFGWSKGFSVFDNEMTNVELARRTPERIAEHTTLRAIKLMKQFQKDQLFMWIHYQDPHGPYTPPEPFDSIFRETRKESRDIPFNMSLSGYGGIPLYQRHGNIRDYHYYVSMYDGEIRYHDEHFRILMNYLKQVGLYDEAVIIFSADHGEGMGEHDYYFAHGENLYKGLMHVPLIVRYGKELEGRRKAFVQHLDIAPTILDLVDIRKDPRLRGKDLLSLDLPDREIFAEMESPMIKDGVRFSIVFGGFKLIHTLLDDRLELFDLKADPHEENDLADSPAHQERKKDLLARLRRIRREDLLGLNIVNKPPVLTREEIEKMRSLGYVQ